MHCYLQLYQVINLRSKIANQGLQNQKLWTNWLNLRVKFLNTQKLLLKATAKLFLLLKVWNMISWAWTDLVTRIILWVIFWSIFWRASQVCWGACHIRFNSPATQSVANSQAEIWNLWQITLDCRGKCQKCTVSIHFYLSTALNPAILFLYEIWLSITLLQSQDQGSGGCAFIWFN